MVEATCQALKRTLAKRDDRKCVEIDGYSHFLFLNRKGYPKTSGDFDSILRNLIKKYNKYHEEKLPHITPHTLRHTFCTNCANAGMNPKALQYIMGHANITMTLNYYAHATYNKEKTPESLYSKALRAFKNIQNDSGKFVICLFKK